MSGIIKCSKPLILAISLLILMMQFALMAGVVKSVKVSTEQSHLNRETIQHKASSEKQPYMGSTLMQQRASRYINVSDPGTGINNQTSKAAIQDEEQTVYRDANLAKQFKSHEFFFSSAYVAMNTDMDGDGYYSEFTVSFDADTNFNYATVYARLYLSLNGGLWQHYYTTEYFDLEGWSAYDDFSVRTMLTSGFPPGSYDILIDLYDVYDNSMVATYSPSDTYELAQHYLEDVSYEDNSMIYSNFSIFDASITLLTDNDNDGFYQSFSLQFDADVDAGNALVYAEIWLKDSTGVWQLDYSTENFIIEGNSTLDTYILETVWESGYRTGYYDFRIDLFDANSFELVASSSRQTYQLSAVPLEDAASDQQNNSGGGGGNTSYPSSVSQGSGGAGSTGLLMMILLLSVTFRRLNNQKQSSSA